MTAGDGEIRVRFTAGERAVLGVAGVVLAGLLVAVLIAVGASIVQTRINTQTLVGIETDVKSIDSRLRQVEINQGPK